MKRLSKYPIVKTPKYHIERKPIQDSWSFVTKNYTGLTKFYAKRYSASFGRYELRQDYERDILYRMVQAYDKYRALGKTDRELDKILKTVPCYYYNNVIKRKAHSHTRKSLDITIETKDVSAFEHMYDKYYDKYLDDYLSGGGKLNHTKTIFYEILYTSKEFKEFMVEHKGSDRISLTVLKKWFRHKYKWNAQYFTDKLKSIVRLVG